MNLKNKNLYYIGGVVRDEILGTPNFDIDLTYNGNAIEFAKNLPDAEIVQINEPFGTVRIKLKSPHPTSLDSLAINGYGSTFHPPLASRSPSWEEQYIDIASTRSEIYPQKGHLPVVDKIGCSLKEDVMRRDFTINAMAKSTLTGEIIDYTNGLQDIKTKTLRVLHDNSFIDDPTRIVRMLKFAVRFGFEPDNHTKKLQDDYLANINYDMSYKRLKKELIETFNLNKWSAFERFAKQGIYKLVSPQNFELPKYDFSKLIEQFSPDNCWIIYIGLLPDISNLPLTKAEKQIVDEFNKIKNAQLYNDFEICKTFKNIPVESIIMYSTINSEIVKKYLNELKDIDILIDGNDLKALGIKPSPKYQECFDFILENKIQNQTLTKEDEIKLTKEFFKII